MLRFTPGTRHHLRRGIAVTIVALATVAGAAPAQGDSTWRDHERAMQEARKANDTASYRAQLEAVYHTVGATPRIVARFASLAIAAHDTAGAARWLSALATMGIELDTAMVTPYRTLAGAPAAAALGAMYTDATRDAGGATVAFRLRDVDMIAEDIAYDAARKRYLVSSVHHGGIYAVDARGAMTTVMKPRAGGSWGMFAVGADRAGAIWTTSAALPMAAGFSPSDSGRSMLVRYDPHGERISTFFPPDSGPHALGDLTIGAQGDVYVSDGLGSAVYALAPGHAAMRVLVPSGILVSPQTPALSSDGETLFVPDYAIGIAAADVRSGAVSWLAHSDSLALTGIDGLYRTGRDLIVVQNGMEPNRIMRLTLDASMRRVVRATVLARGPSARSLTHAALANGWLYYITNSGWERVGDDGAMRAGTPSDAPAVMRLRIAP
jgi:sugar lactone lactonase YvrE